MNMVAIRKAKNNMDYTYQHVELSLQQIDNVDQYVIDCWTMGMTTRDAKTKEWLDPDETYNFPSFIAALLTINQMIANDELDLDGLCLRPTQSLKIEIEHAHDIIGISGVDKPMTLGESATALKAENERFRGLLREAIDWDNMTMMQPDLTERIENALGADHE